MSTPVIATPSSLAMSRSPQFITGKNNTLAADTLESMTLSLRIRTGTLSASGNIDYTVGKNYSIDEVINFEVSDLVRGNFSHPFGKAFIVAPSASETGEALWVVPTGSWIFSNNGASPSNAIFPEETEAAYAYLTIEGYKVIGELQNSGITQSNLFTLRPMQVLASNYQSLPVSYNLFSGLDGFNINIDGVNYTFSLLDELGWSNATTATTEMVVYIPSGVQNIASYLGVTPTDEYTITLLPNSETIAYNDRVKADGGTIESLGCVYAEILALGGEADAVDVDFEVVCEPKYQPYQIQFVNRYGMSDYITFFKKSTERGSFTQDSYQKSIYADGFTDVNYATGKYQSFNINSRNTLTLNTGFVDESYGDIVEELLMSEKVAIYEGGQWVAVVPERGSIDYQKSINDKTINYTMSFTYAFDQRMLVR